MTHSVHSVHRLSAARTYAWPAELADVLTQREREVLELVAHGRVDPEIAMLLGIGPQTVKTHIRHILRKLRARNRTQAVAIAMRREIIG